MKKITLFFIALFCVIFLYAQKEKTNNTEALLEDTLLFPLDILDCEKYIPRPLSLDAPRTSEECFRQAELIFEGERLECVATYNTQGNRSRYDTYGIVAYKVNKVYKGDPTLTGKTIYLIEYGWVLGGEKVQGMMHVAYVNPYSLRKNGIYGWGWKTIHFFTTSDFPENGIPEKYSNIKKYKLLEKEFEDLYEYEDKILGLDDLLFHNREEFYNYTRQFEGFIIPEMNSQFDNRSKNKGENEPVIDSDYINIRDSTELF